MTTRVDFEVWSTTATLVVTEPSAMDVASSTRSPIVNAM